MRKVTLLVVAASLCYVTRGQDVNRCGTHEIVKQQISIDPGYARKVEELLKNKSNHVPDRKGRPPAPSSITIPVVVHILYNTPDQNITDAQVQSQIDVLNEDFTATNRDYRNYDAGYGAVKGEMDINFCLVQVIHKQTKVKSFAANDNMKFSKRGGSDAVDPMHVFNIWVCNLGQNLLGYAYYPGISPEKFGVVCHTIAFGRGSGYNLFTDYNLGRTTTHEVGHSFGLVHIWGDSNCGSDEVDDTPLHNTYNFGCPEQGHTSTCMGTPLEMWMNYMDYTDDRCMYFFTDGQTARANFFIDTDPQLNSIVNSACGSSRSANNDITSVPGSGWHPSKAILDNDLIIYPTITSGQLNITFGNIPGDKVVITVYNQAGSLMLKRQVAGKTPNQIDVSKLTNGMYFLQVSEGNRQQIRKFIVQH